MPIAVATPVVYVVRVYGDENDRDVAGSKWWKKYDYSFTAIVTEDTVTIEGFAPETGIFNTAHRVAIFAELRRIGAKFVRWVRLRDGGEKREIKIPLDRF